MRLPLPILAPVATIADGWMKTSVCMTPSIARTHCAASRNCACGLCHVSPPSAEFPVEEPVLDRLAGNHHRRHFCFSRAGAVHLGGAGEFQDVAAPFDLDDLDEEPVAGHHRPAEFCVV